jgi:hypothetical protein
VFFHNSRCDGGYCTWSRQEACLQHIHCLRHSEFSFSLGALFLGAFFSAMYELCLVNQMTIRWNVSSSLWGITLAQVFHYYTTRPKDSGWIKLMASGSTTGSDMRIWLIFSLIVGLIDACIRHYPSGSYSDNGSVSDVDFVDYWLLSCLSIVYTHCITHFGDYEFLQTVPRLIWSTMSEIHANINLIGRFSPVWAVLL